MMRLPQVHQRLREVENHLRLTRNRLGFYELLDEHALADTTRLVVRALEQTQHLLTTRLQTPAGHAQQKI